MDGELAERVRIAVAASDRALSSGEVAARLKVPLADVEAALERLQSDPRLVVREWPMTDPHFGVARVVVAARVEPADDAGLRAAEDRCQQVYDDLLRDFLASHRCV